MGRVTKVPITPEVLDWAVTESGFGLEAVAAAAGVHPSVFEAWLAGRARPSLTQARAVASKLRRPLATFLLPKPPRTHLPAVDFRRPPGSVRTELNPEERYALREAVRIQRVISWALQETGAKRLTLPRLTISVQAEHAANSVRRLLAVPEEARVGWQSPSEALAGWRAALERIGVLVFLFPMGSMACRGFSVWDDYAPLIVANTWWNVAARLFTLLHEFGHLVTRTSSACLAPTPPLRVRGGDATERWCEEFAAAILLPGEEIERYLEEHTGWRRGEQISDLRPVTRLARALNVSLRATMIRLIKAGIAKPELYNAISPTTDYKRGGGGGEGRRRHQARHEQLGSRTVHVLLEAVSSGVLTTSDVLSYLNVGYSDLATLASEAKQAFASP